VEAAARRSSLVALLDALMRQGIIVIGGHQRVATDRPERVEPLS